MDFPRPFGRYQLLEPLAQGGMAEVFLARSVGLHRAKELALTGRFFSAAEAQSWGLVSRVVAAEQLLAEAQAMARPDD